MDHTICNTSFISVTLKHSGEMIYQVTNKQTFRCQHTNPSEHLYYIKLGVFLKDVLVHSLSNRLEWLSLLFCQIKRNFSGCRYDCFNSQTANFLGISSSCFLTGLSTIRSSRLTQALAIAPI